jgi:hypothetical protein
MYNTEAGWRIVDDAMQIRGGRGYETADSLRARGEKPYAVERAMRDFRINLIFEGSSEVMRLFIAREAVDHHMRLAFQIVNPEASWRTRLRALAAATPFYATWYPARWVPWAAFHSYAEFGALGSHLRFAHRATNRLGRSIFHAMVRFGPGLERRQAVLFRVVEIGAELFAIAAACARAQMLSRQGRPEGLALADAFCREARTRVRQRFGELFGPHDRALAKVAAQVMDGRHTWLEAGIIDPLAPEPVTAEEIVERGEALGVGD